MFIRGLVIRTAANDCALVTVKEANAILTGRHYLGALEYQPRFCIATDDRKALAAFSSPISHHFKRELHEPLELARLWRANGSSVILSQFLAAALRWLRKLAPDSDCVFSYADPAQKHVGTIYQATNFVYLGASRATDYWRKPNGELVSSPVCYRLFKTKSREKIKELNPRWKLIRGEPKHLYLYGLKRTPDEILRAIRGRYRSRQAFPKLRGRGRPHGRSPIVTLALPHDLLERLDGLAERESATRAKTVRRLLERGLRSS